MTTTTMKSQKGFSLVELMVVVAILGILATMAVPQVTKFMAKARQAEAKSNLAAIYTANKAFYTEYNGYHTAFGAIGYAPEGKMRYNVGFGAACATPPSGYTLPSSVNAAQISSATYCDNVKCTVLAEGATQDLGASTADQTTFTATAASNLLNKTGAGANIDTWTIDHNKNVVNTISGID